MSFPFLSRQWSETYASVSSVISSMSPSGPCVVFVSKVNDTLKTIDIEITKINGDHQFCFTLLALHIQYICIVYFAVHASKLYIFIILTAENC